MNKINLLNMENDYWIILKESDRRTEGQVWWWCKCKNCGNIRELRSYQIRKKTKSCGCLARRNVSLSKKRYNNYDLTGEYGIGYTSKEDSFYFDLEDYDKIKNICWIVSTTDRYLYGWSPDFKKIVVMHRVIFDFPDCPQIDHENHNRSDNRKSNIRKVTFSQNSWNSGLGKNNKTGIIGVTMRKYNKKRIVFVASIGYMNKRIHLFESKDFNNVVFIRLMAEKQYYGEFAPQRHLFAQYGIEE